MHHIDLGRAHELAIVVVGDGVGNVPLFRHGTGALVVTHGGDTNAVTLQRLDVRGANKPGANDTGAEGGNGPGHINPSLTGGVRVVWSKGSSPDRCGRLPATSRCGTGWRPAFRLRSGWPTSSLRTLPG